MLYPYSRSERRGAAVIDRWVEPGWKLLERHEQRVPAPPDRALAAIASVTLRELPAVRALLALRRLPFEPDATLGGFFSTPPFLLLEAVPGRELVYGVLMCRRRARERVREPDDFRAAVPGVAGAAVVNFRAEPVAGGSVLSTETWVVVRGGARLAFAPYWLAIGPWSAWIRVMFLRAARRRALADVAPHAAP